MTDLILLILNRKTLKARYYSNKVANYLRKYYSCYYVLLGRCY